MATLSSCPPPGGHFFVRCYPMPVVVREKVLRDNQLAQQARIAQAEEK
jgi:hypothetical protein